MENTVPALLSLLELERLSSPGASDADCVRAIARGVIGELGLTGPPVNVEMVASALDIGDVFVDPRLDVAGCLICQASMVQIRVRAGDGPSRRRFTVCHECSHTFFPGYSLVPQFRCSPSLSTGDRQDVESLCDIGASELLLPECFFGPAVAAASFSIDGLTELSDCFEASVAATGSRVVRAWPERAAFLSFEDRQKPSERGTAAAPKLRLQSVVASGTWPYFRKHKSVVDGDVFDRASQGEIVSENTVIHELTAQPVAVEVHAQLMPYRVGTELRRRVVALVRQPVRRN